MEGWREGEMDRVRRVMGDWTMGRVIHIHNLTHVPLVCCAVLCVPHLEEMGNAQHFTWP